MRKKASRILFTLILALGLAVSFSLLTLLPIATPAQAQVEGDYRSTGTGNWDVLNKWERYDGTKWVTPTAAQGTPTNFNANVITIRKGHTITVAANVAADQMVIEAGGQLTVNNVALTIVNGPGTDLDVNGTVSLAGDSGSFTINDGATMAFNDGSTYSHDRNGGTIPIATWNTTSTCLVTGVTSIMPGGLDQNFGNLTWNCTKQTVSNDPGTVIKVAGDLTIKSTGKEGAFEFAPGTSTVSRSYSQTGGTVRLSGGPARNLYVSDNFSLSGGTFYMDSGGTVEIRAAKSSQLSQVKIYWWFIGGIAIIIIALVIWILVRWRRFGRY
jgi:hypothetical protein